PLRSDLPVQALPICSVLFLCDRAGHLLFQQIRVHG
ncbi:MAG: hypothetical protein ACI9AQ_002807, partial [Dinoroseobacter sp.]